MMPSAISLNAVRVVFLCITCLLGMLVALGFGAEAYMGGIVGFCFGASVVALELLLKNFTFRGFSHGTIGLMVGLFCAWLVLRVDFFDNPWVTEKLESAGHMRQVFELLVYTTLGFLGVMLALRSDREEFSFIIPYVRFRQDALQEQPLLVDTNIIIDGRIPRVCATGFLSGSIIIPRFVLDELHVLADSPNPLKRERGKRGLEGLNQMKHTPGLHITVHEDRQEREELTDTKLIQLARRLGARIATNDSNLGKVARLQGVKVLNFNDLARAMRPVVAPGDQLELMLVKEGKDPHQAVGYLPDGTMIVVNHAAERIGGTAEIIVGGTLQTSAGRLIFAELAENSEISPLSDSAGAVESNPSVERSVRGSRPKSPSRLPESV
jgi:uncharacterized protein YacL